MEIRPEHPTFPIDSYIHNHFTKIDPDTGLVAKSLPVFSGGDLYTLFNLYNGELINDLSSFVMFVTTPGVNINSPDDDTLYAITVSNSVQFVNVADALGVTPLLIGNEYENYNIRLNINVLQNEKKLAEIFKENNELVSLVVTVDPLPDFKITLVYSSPRLYKVLIRDVISETGKIGEFSLTSPTTATLKLRNS